MPYREGGNSVLTGDLSRINRTIKAVRQSEFDKTSIKDPVITTLKSLRKTLPTIEDWTSAPGQSWLESYNNTIRSLYKHSQATTMRSEDGKEREIPSNKRAYKVSERFSNRLTDRISDLTKQSTSGLSTAT